MTAPTRTLVTACLLGKPNRVAASLLSPDLDINDTITKVVARKKSTVQYDIYGRSALYLAIWTSNPHSSNHAACVRLLLEQPGIDRNFKNTDIHPDETQCRIPWFPLALAMRKGNTEILTLLMADPPPFPADSKYAQPLPLDLTATLDDSYTPLHYAAENGHAECVKLFLERLLQEDCRNKKINKKNKKKNKREVKPDSCAVCAVCSSTGSNPPTHHHALKRCDQCRVVYYCSRTCQIQHWKKGGHKQECKRLRKKALNTSHVKQMMNKRLRARQAPGLKKGVMTGGATPLFLAAESGRVEVVKEFLKHEECDFNLQSADGKTPFMVSVLVSNSSSTICQYYQKDATLKGNSEGSLTIANILLDLGPGRLNINAHQTSQNDSNDSKYAGGSTALFLACSANVPSLIERMLKEYRGTIDVNVQRDLGTTALYIACQRGHYDCVSLLLELAADTIDVNRSMFDNPMNTPATISLSPYRHLPVNSRGSDEDRQRCYDLLLSFSSKPGRPSIMNASVKKMMLQKEPDVARIIAGKDKKMNQVLEKLSTGCTKREYDELVKNPDIQHKLKRLMECGYIGKLA